MAVATRKAPPTHPSVWIGLGLATLGLFVALYAYTGTRVYDVTFAAVALVGGVVALAGILVSAWGRAVMAARASRSRRSVMKEDTLKLAEVALEQPPTVAEPASKRRIDLANVFKIDLSAATSRLKFKRAPRPGGAEEAAVVETPPQSVRVTLKCPDCGTEFTSEGVRPFTATCPQCAFSADV
jgi:hypothetical protein